MVVDRLEFRDVMARVGAAISVVTTAGPAGRCGFTCTSACSVSDDPATMLVCLNRNSRMNPVFKRNGVFCVNVLGAGQDDLSAMFAGRKGGSMEDRFVKDKWGTLATGAPALCDGIGAVDCVISDVKECGTHSVLFGTVASIRLNELRGSLIYFNRQHHALMVTPKSLQLDIATGASL